MNIFTLATVKEKARGITPPPLGFTMHHHGADVGQPGDKDSGQIMLKIPF